MTETPMIAKQRLALKELARLASERVRAEAEAEGGTRARKAAADKELQTSLKRSLTAFEKARDAATTEADEARRTLEERFAKDYGAIEQEYLGLRSELEEGHLAAKDASEKESREAAWSVTTVYEANKNRFNERKSEVRLRTHEALERAQTIQKEAVALLASWGFDSSYEKTPSPSKQEAKGEDALDQITRRIAQADRLHVGLNELTLPHYFKGERILWMYAAFSVVAVIVTACILRVLGYTESVPVYASGWPKGWFFWIGGCIVLVVMLCSVLHQWLTKKVHRQVDDCYPPLRQALAEVRALCKRSQEETQDNPEDQRDYKHRRDRDLRKVDEKYYAIWEEMKNRFVKESRRIEEKYPSLLAETKQRHEQELRLASETNQRLQAELQARLAAEEQQARNKNQKTLEEEQVKIDTQWNSLKSSWLQGVTQAKTQLLETITECGNLFLDWSDPNWSQWKPPQSIPSGVPFGKFHIALSQIPHGIPSDPRLQDPGPNEFDLPALLPFPERGSLLFKADDAGREETVRALQTVMLRLLTSLPPGKVRFTIFDPVGLGENFASFMHLADFDELLVTNRIWTEPQHVEQRLADLTEHMENVIQKYLRNQFQSIEEYNVHAGEVAEPYRILVVADFPVNFNDATARRLVSIAASGASCGVYTLVGVDTKQMLPQGFSLKDLERSSEVLTWKDGRFVWRDEDLGKFPLSLEQPPSAELGTRLLNLIGAQAKLANRVEVPFETIAPADDRWWADDSRKGISVPLGRAGATKLQYLQLGEGTSQHVLIAGKTGSGKSTLLHALITNLALRYSPREIEFYLIDFKKGVEFSTYARHELPHARVVAIESEREFGLSVLQRLDLELRQRGERFREQGVQDLNGFRQAHPAETLPRIMLIVDEFQEFFVEDDKIAQDVSLLLDRLVRQGRAFGIHILLGSQTLGGAYSLARSTLGQMAVRIALQCSEADANLILSENNSAARLLTRPGEAIYNDANGMVEGNDFFQIVWLSDERRESYLLRIQALARTDKFVPPQPQIVFEGSAPADIDKNFLLHRLMSGKSQPTPKAAHAWLGEAIAIKDPTAAVFRAQSGCNLLIVGQQEEAALAIVASALVCLHAQQTKNRTEPSFFVLDGTPSDARHSGFLTKLASALSGSLQLAGTRETAQILAQVAEISSNRQQANDSEALPVFLFIHGLQRFRDLRKQDDDFGFSREEKAATPAQNLSTILREGPALGVHVVVWCDSFNNVNRAFDRQILREFELRVLFQISATDSSNLIDSPAAGKLGMNRALFHTEESGQPEKFRPYGLPTDDWLEQIKERFSEQRLTKPV